MTAIATRLLVVLLVAGAAPCATAGAQTGVDPKPQPEVSQTPPEPVAIDVARIRRLLNEPQPFGSGGGLRDLAPMLAFEIRPQPIPIEANGMLRFSETVNVVGFIWKKPTIAEELKALEEQDRFPYNYAPSLQELTARIPQLQYVHPVNAVMAASKAVRGALYRRKVEKARREVEAELREVQARYAATAAADQKPPDRQR